MVLYTQVPALSTLRHMEKPSEQLKPSSLSKKAQDPCKALLNYRNTPLEGIGLPPAQLIMVRRLKTSLPTHADLLKTHGAQEVKDHFQKRKLKEKVYYDEHSGKELPPLKNGEKVTLQHGNKWVPATVISKHHTPRSYIVQTPETSQKSKVKSIGETTDTWTNAEHLKAYQQPLRMINPRRHPTAALLKSMQYLFLLQKHHLHKRRNL